MKCPMLAVARASGQLPEDEVIDDCLREECALWDKALGRCMFITIGDALEDIATTLAGIRERMPHAGQSGK